MARTVVKCTQITTQFLYLYQSDPAVLTTMTPWPNHLAVSYTRPDIPAPCGASTTCLSDSEQNAQIPPTSVGTALPCINKHVADRC